VVQLLFAFRERWILWRERRAKEADKKRDLKDASKNIKKPAPKIINRDGAAATRKKAPVVQEAFEFVREKDGYHLPPDDVFELGGPSSGPDEESLQMKARLLVKKLKDFGVEGTVETVHPGPVITMFEFKPAPGVTISRIVNRGDDLALALRAMSIRIVAPIPGKDTVGVEIPNADRQMVTLGDVLGSPEARASKAKLMIGLGKGTSGKPVVADLAKMPHLLIAGATGSGKSVAVHAMLASLLQRATPKDVRLLIIDPKMLELSVYDNIPHLLWPVVTDAKQAAKVLRWAVAKMEERYRLMAEEEGVRDIGTFNKKMEKQKLARGRKPAVGGAGETLPYIVIIIDELADLMMVSGKEVEESIARLAQKARAAGIHLILATQRPSVDVITGMIKANFPARIAFQVVSKIDSRTILDAMGAETLLGDGDMLYLPPGTARMQRIHGSYVSEEEVRKLVKFLRSQGKPDYDESVMADTPDTGYDADPEFDELYDQAVQFVAESRQASVSMIQRKFKIGYNRAARIIETMEREGVVGPSRGAKPREVLVGDF
jgi:S-DNA-T family DNA segregation ATPase FtsK/SpoIIIE